MSDKNTKILIHLPDSLKRKLDDLRRQGVPTSWFVRALLEREFAKPPGKQLRPAMLKNSAEVDEEIDEEIKESKKALSRLRPMIREAVREAMGKLTNKEIDVLRTSLRKKKGGTTHGAKG